VRFDKAAIYIRHRGPKRWPKGRSSSSGIGGSSLRLSGLVYENNGRFSDMAAGKNMILYAKLNYCTARKGARKVMKSLQKKKD